MADKIYLRGGLAASRPTLGLREPGFDTDTRKLWIGSPIGNVQVAMATQEAWIAPTLLNSWINFGAATSAAGYVKDDMGVVRLKGLLKSGVTTPLTIILTLPAGYRPSEQLTFSVESFNGSYIVGVVSVDTNGSVVIQAGGNGSLSLDGITFRAY